jgi:predicted dinucleotide-utilizing enzyme
MSRFPMALPTARTPDAAAAPALRWGILGTGWIAERFISTVQRNTRQRIEAIGSRGADRSAAFATRFGVPRSYGSYEQLVADPALDVVYVATPHNAHLAGARSALEAGKHVLVDKPLALNAAQAAEVARCVHAGRLESPIRPLADSIGTLGVIDEIRRQIGAAFPDEDPEPAVRSPR